ncbi:zinc finger protein 710 [Lucilia cuprina]|uniref:zinc finger protein 710 n=1 Tax=Lucilia cuprina TaxID=7375 RepID=UPI001F06F544|nr:zinc finger protein 710 [Lucilia cuprina]
MNFLQNNIEHYTPTKEQLKPFHQIKCSQPNCSSIFTNQANYEMHLEKHHRLAPAEKTSYTRLFYCPEEKCIYNYVTTQSKHFKNFKYLRQHYQKVHLSKDYICEECKKSFATETQLNKHQKDQCGKKFICNDCHWSYDSMEALLTHGKRKGHNVKEIVAQKKNQGKMALKPLKKANKEEQPAGLNKQQVAKEIQVDFCPKLLCATSVQTDFLPVITETNSQQDISNALDEIHSLLRDIETQTEPLLSSSSSSNENHNYLDQMLAQSSHMYTQTCDDFLTELGLADIQTQTNWPSPDAHNETSNVQFTSTATSTNPCIHDELLVSTETQTSFTQCLLNSCNDAGTSTPPVSFGSLYHTQHTQTCDPLLESFDFGGQASDLIDGFQSTYTQT